MQFKLMGTTPPPLHLVHGPSYKHQDSPRPRPTVKLPIFVDRVHCDRADNSNHDLPVLLRVFIFSHIKTGKKNTLRTL